MQVTRERKATRLNYNAAIARDSSQGEALDIDEVQVLLNLDFHNAWGSNYP